MAKKKRTIPEINAGSMADIAFLLLIFFLVTTTIATDTGIPVKLPEMVPPEKNDVNQRNVLEILVNSNNQLLVEGKPLSVEELKEKTKEFVTNDGRDPNLSDSAQVAVVSLKSDRGTNYETYITVWNELTAAYNELRNGYAKTKYGKPYEDLEDEPKKVVNARYPKLVSEAEPENYGGN